MDLSVKESTALGDLKRTASRKGIEVPKGLGFCASRNLHTVSIGIMLPYQRYVNLYSKFNNESEKTYFDIVKFGFELCFTNNVVSRTISY